MEQSPVLSIGIIFKNEIRCLERCLKSLRPLRDALPCEVVMADTGSGDGSREIAQQYADVLFDFPWIDDFAAARNAVMERCSGKWFFFIDADEWLDEDVSALVEFFSPGGDEPKADACAITEHNYYWPDFDRGYGSFMPWRLLRMSTGVRFQGKIHEHWSVFGLRGMALSRVLLHHDGYVSMNVEGEQKKRERNLKPLREEVERDPDNLLVRLQIVESGGREPDFEEQLRYAVSLVEKRAEGWKVLGPSVLRHAVSSARDRKLPEIEDWIHMAEELFPDSYFIRMDAAFNAAAYYLEAEKFDESARWARIGLKAHEDYRNCQGDFTGRIYGSLQTTTPLSEAALRIILARALFEQGRTDEAAEPLAGFSFTVLDAQWTMNLLETLQMFQFRSEMDTAPLITRLWEEILLPQPSRKWADERRDTFLRTALPRFDTDYLKKENRDPSFCRRVCTLYSPLAGRNDLGTAAAVRACGWKEPERGMKLARTFARVERAYLAGYCAPEVLQEGNLWVLSAMHRFGWYCAQAFDALEAGDTTAYVRLLREALTSYEGAKPMVEFLLEHTPELQTPPPSPELLELAEKVRTMLAAYSPSDPAVAALKASPAYQKVAHLIEIP